MSIKESPEAHAPRRTDRRNFLKIAGIVGLGLAGGYATDLGGIRSRVSGTVDKNHEKIEGYRFKLGQFEFVFPTGQLDAERVRQLEQNIRVAYKKLEDYFGPKVLAANYEQEIIVSMGSGKEYWGGQVAEELEFNDVQDNKFSVSLPTQRTLGINGIDNIRSITHELFHLAVQWNMPNHSLAVTEGHAEAMEDELGFKTDPADKIFEEAPELEQLLSRNGWDISRNGYTQLAEKAAKKAANSAEKKEIDGQMALVHLLRRKWRLDWRKLLKKDPDFMRKYYAKIAEYKQARNLSAIFENDGLYDTAQSVFSGFREWRDTEGISTKPTYATEPAKIMFGKMVGPNTILLINIGTGKPEGPTASQFHYRNAADELEIVGSCATCDSGKMVVTITNQPNEPTMERFELPKEFTPKAIQFEGKEVFVIPFIKKREEAEAGNAGK